MYSYFSSSTEKIALICFKQLNFDINFYFPSIFLLLAYCAAPCYSFENSLYSYYVQDDQLELCSLDRTLLEGHHHGIYEEYNILVISV